MSLLSRLNSRIRQEGFSKTVQYGLLVGADTLKTYLEDTYLDIKYSGRMLHGNIPTKFKAFGANDVYHTDYSAMPLIFANVPINDGDVLVDVGCGKGRVINYWLSKNVQNPIIGLELDPELAAKTTRQFTKCPNVKVIAGDAIENLPPEGTIFYFYNPFDQQKVVEFERRLREVAGGNKVQIAYYNPRSLSAFDNDYWTVRLIDFEKDFGVKRWGRLNKYHQLAIITTSSPLTSPQTTSPRRRTNISPCPVSGRYTSSPARRPSEPAPAGHRSPCPPHTADHPST